MREARRTAVTGIVGALLWAGPVLAQGGGAQQQGRAQGQGASMGQGGQQRQGATGQEGRQGQQQIGDELRSALQKLHAANQAEIQLGKAAQQQARSEDVKQFASTMVEQHRSADGKLQQAASRLGVQLEGDAFREAMDEFREKRQELTQKQGAEFDRAYMDFMVQDHQEDVQQVHDAAMKAADEARPQLAQVLGQTEATLHQHHARAQQIQQKLQQRQAQSGPSQQGGQQAMAGQAEQSGTGSQAGSSQQGGQQAQASKSVVGTVQSIQGESLSLKNKLGETNEFTLGDDTRFTRDGKSISKNEISEGDEVRAAFTGDAGNLKATEIILMGGGSGTGSSQGQQSTGSAGQQSTGNQSGDQQKKQ